jgi:hypothetical protein
LIPVTVPVSGGFGLAMNRQKLVGVTTSDAGVIVIVPLAAVRL